LFCQNCLAQVSRTERGPAAGLDATHRKLFGRRPGAMPLWVSPRKAAFLPEFGCKAEV
jgi:hypothetical protein